MDILSMSTSIALAQDNILSQPAQRFTETVNYYNNLIILFLVITIFLSTMVIIAKYLEQNQPHLELRHFISKPKNKTRITLEVIDQNNDPIRHAKITLIDKKGDIVEQHYTNKDGLQNISNIKSGSVTIEGFGYERVVKQLKGKNVKIKMKRTTDLLLNPLSLQIKKLTRWLLVPTGLLGLYLSLMTGEYVSEELRIFLGIVSVITFLIIFINKPRFLVIVDRKGNRMKRAKILFANEKGEEIASTVTDNRARIQSIAIPGFYKISSEGTVPRVVKINSTEPNLKVKLT